jgi:hypothetical protein
MPTDDPIPVKRVKTKETETEFHDPLRYQMAKSYVAPKPRNFGDFGGTIVRMKDDCCSCSLDRKSCQ